MPEHTPTPWSFHEQGDANQYYILAPHGRWVLGLLHNGEPLRAEQLANLRRIVAAVNAVEGIPTELLARGVLEALFRTANKVLRLGAPNIEVETAPGFKYEDEPAGLSEVALRGALDELAQHMKVLGQPEPSEEATSPAVEDGGGRVAEAREGCHTSEELSTATRFAHRFSARAAEPYVMGSAWRLSHVGLTTCDDELVRTEYTFQSDGARAQTLTVVEDAVIFDPSRDLEFEFESAANALGYDLTDAAQLQEVLTSFREVGMIDEEFESPASIQEDE